MHHREGFCFPDAKESTLPGYMEVGDVLCLLFDLRDGEGKGSYMVSVATLNGMSHSK
jgi:hypothetical protein